MGEGGLQSYNVHLKFDESL